MAKFNINSLVSVVKPFTPAAVFAGVGKGVGSVMESLQMPIILLGGLAIVIMLNKK